MTETYKVTWKDIWGKTNEHTAETKADAMEWILRRRHRDDIIQESWRVIKQ